jgi:hypothetical protein
VILIIHPRCLDLGLFDIFQTDYYLVVGTGPTCGTFFPEASWNELFSSTFNRSYESLIIIVAGCWDPTSGFFYLILKCFPVSFLKILMWFLDSCGITGSVYRQLLILAYGESYLAHNDNVMFVRFVIVICSHKTQIGVVVPLPSCRMKTFPVFSIKDMM